MPVLRVNPNTGESLDLTKTAKEAAEVEARKVKELEEYRERVKDKKPRKKKEVLEKLKLAEEVLAVETVKEIPVKVNPFTSPNGEIVVEDLLAPLNVILKDIEEGLQRMTKGYKLDTSQNDWSTKVSLPDKFEYKPSVTRVNAKDSTFTLNKPTGVVSLSYNDIQKDIYVDRVLLKPLDVRELLKFPDKARKSLEDLVIHGMWKNLWETKQLDPGKKYFGNVVATLKRPGMGENFAFKHTGDIDFVEIRLYSDATLIPGGK